MLTLPLSTLAGLVAIILSVLSRTAADNGDIKGARIKARLSLGLSMAGILTTVICVVSVLVWFAVFVSTVAHSVSETVNWTNYD